MAEFRRASDMLFHPGIGSLELEQLPPTKDPIHLLSLTAGYGGMSAQDLYALLRVVHWLRPRRIFELGTFHGVTTAHVALNCDAEIYTLDLPREVASGLRGYAERDLALLQPEAHIGQYYRQFNSDNRIHQLFGDSLGFNYQPYTGTMDLVLIDACHIFDYVMSDSYHAFELLAKSGVVLWHDFGNSRDVMRALRILAKQQPIMHIEGTALALSARGILGNESSPGGRLPNAQEVA